MVDQKRMNSKHKKNQTLQVPMVHISKILLYHVRLILLPICVLGYLEVPGISVSLFPSLIMSHLPVSLDMAMDQYLLIPFLMG